MTIYRWKPGANVKIAPDVAGAELERIRTKANGRLTPEGIVASARRPTSPLHPHFEWDDAKAASAHRITQAGYLIRSIEVLDAVEGQKKPIRAFVSVVRDEDRSYVSTAHALSDSDLRRQVVDRAWRDLEAWRERHAELIEFAAVFTAMDQARGAE